MRLESAEVVDAHCVIQIRRRTIAFDPPAVAVFPQTIPAINWITPALSGGTEIVGRNAGNYDRLSCRSEAKILWVRPHIGAVERDINGDIADDAKSRLMRIGTECLPLAEKLELPVLHR